MTESMEDSRLMRQIAERDASALELLYDRYERAVYSFAYRIVGDPMTAEETVQELLCGSGIMPNVTMPHRGS